MSEHFEIHKLENEIDGRVVSINLQFPCDRDEWKQRKQ
jgi:hypothetical protein